MATLNNLKSAIKLIAENISGIGIVYDKLVYAKNQDELKTLFLIDGKINVLMFRPATRKPDETDGGTRGDIEILIDRNWKMLLLRGYNLEQDSEVEFDNLCELLCQTFNTGNALEIVNWHSYLTMTNKTEIMYHNVLCHSAEFDLTTTSDLSEQSISLPSQVTLSTPADGYTSGDISNADFAWLAASDAVSYHFQISTTPNFVSYYEQDNILYLKHTVIEGILNNEVQYYWRVRARNTAGYGAWSTSRSWLTSSGIAPLTEAETGADFLLDATLGVTLVSGKVSQWNDQIGTFHIAQGIDANRPTQVTEPTTGKTAIRFNPTAIGEFACLSKLDPTNLFKIAGTETKSFMLTLIISNTVASNIYGLSIGGRTNINLGDQWVIGCPDVGLNIKTFYIGFPRGHASTTLNAVEGITIPSVRLIHLIYVVENLVIKTYVDGQLRCTHNNFSSEVLLPDGNASNAFLLGAKRTNNQGSAPFNGYIFKGAKWSKALTADEVAGLYKTHTNYFGL